MPQAGFEPRTFGRGEEQRSDHSAIYSSGDI